MQYQIVAFITDLPIFKHTFLTPSCCRAVIINQSCVCKCLPFPDATCNNRRLQQKQENMRCCEESRVFLFSIVFIFTQTLGQVLSAGPVPVTNPVFIAPRAPFLSGVCPPDSTCCSPPHSAFKSLQPLKEIMEKHKSEEKSLCSLLELREIKCLICF